MATTPILKPHNPWLSQPDASMLAVKRKVAVAAAFSPRLKAVLSEAGRIAGFFNSALAVIHAGNTLDQTREALQAEVQSIPLPRSTELVLLETGTPEAILEYINSRELDLLIAGAEEREVSGKNFLGTFARELFRNASCSVLLFTHPRTEPRPFQRILVLIDPSPAAAKAFELAMKLAEYEDSESLNFVSIVSPLQAALADLRSSGAAKRNADEIQAQLDNLVEVAARRGRTAEKRVIESATGNAVSDFAKSVEADLLIVPAQGGRDRKPNLPRYMDWVLQAIPCNVWLMKEEP
jgi:nucleotide-binding universal stress UspA family protein